MSHLISSTCSFHQVYQSLQFSSKSDALAEYVTYLVVGVQHCRHTAVCWCHRKAVDWHQMASVEPAVSADCQELQIIKWDQNCRCRNLWYVRPVSVPEFARLKSGIRDTLQSQLRHIELC